MLSGLEKDKLPGRAGLYCFRKSRYGNATITMIKSDDQNVYGLLGRNISYSLSRVMQNAAFQQLKIPGTYKNFDKQDQEIENFVDKQLLSGKISGLNVTVPYKIKLKDILERKCPEKLEIQDLARYLGAVNTVVISDNVIKLKNTDAMGFYEALTGKNKYEGIFCDAGFSDFKGKKIAVLGAGGAGRTICLTLVHMNNSDIDEI